MLVGIYNQRQARGMSQRHMERKGRVGAVNNGRGVKNPYVQHVNVTLARCQHDCTSNQTKTPPVWGQLAPTTPSGQHCIKHLINTLIMN